MNCEVVAVGTELLLGQIVDTNSSWIGEQLAASGIDSHWQTKVGDNWDRIADSLRLAVSRSDAVIVSGGLGPTPDDITREVLAGLMGVELVADPVIEQRIREMFGRHGRDMPESNLRQAMVPVGARPIPEQPGTAPGLIAELARPDDAGADAADGRGPVVVYLVPGVPGEMRQMVSGTVLADLRRRAGRTDVIASRVLRTWGESESGLAERLGGRIAALDESGNPTLAFLAAGIEGIKVRITVKAAGAAEAAALLDAESDVLTELLGELVFSADDESMEEVVVRLLGESGETVSIAETFTGGLMASRLSAAARAAGAGTGAAGAGPFRAGVVLGHDDVAADFGADPGSAELAAAGMASFVRERFSTSWGLAVAGPGPGAPAGPTAVALAGADGVSPHALRLPGDVELQRRLATISAFNALRRTLEPAG